MPFGNLNTGACLCSYRFVFEDIVHYCNSIIQYCYNRDVFFNMRHSSQFMLMHGYEYHDLLLCLVWVTSPPLPLLRPVWGCEGTSLGQWNSGGQGMQCPSGAVARCVTMGRGAQQQCSAAVQRHDVVPLGTDAGWMLLSFCSLNRFDILCTFARRMNLRRRNNVTRDEISRWFLPVSCQPLIDNLFMYFYN